MATQKIPTGMRVRHSRPCQRSTGGDPCRCPNGPSYEAWVYSARKSIDGKPIGKIYKTFSGKGALAEAKGWRVDALHAKKRGGLRPPIRQTVGQAAEELMAGMKDGSILTRRGRRYRPAVIRGHERALGLTLGERERAPERVLEQLGDLKLSEVDRDVVQDYVNRLHADGWAGSTIANQLDPLRLIFRRARRIGAVAADPLADLELPEAAGKRDRIASPAEARKLLDALPEQDRPLWATALYAGLRRGELRALRWCDVDLKERVIHVCRGWDDKEGEQEPKSDAGDRHVPIIGVLALVLRDHQMRTGRRDRQLVFGTGDGEDEQPFDPTTVRRQAVAAWEAAALKPITPHECRHTFASLLIAARVDARAITTYMGHASITMTFDRYGHLFNDAREVAVQRVDSFLANQPPALMAVD